MSHSRRAFASAIAGLVAASSAAVVLQPTPAASAIQTPPAAAAPAAGPTTRVFITAERTVEMAGAMRPGVRRFVVRSARESAFQIVRTRFGYSDRELARDVESGIDNGDLAALRRFERNVTLLGGVSSAPGQRGVVFVNLTRGRRYIALDTNVSNTVPAKFHHFRVVGARVRAPMPKARTLRAVQEMTWAARPHRIATSGRLGFTNRATDIHFVSMFKLRPGKTIRDWRLFVDAIVSGTNPGPPPVNFDVGLDSGVVSPGHRMVMRYELPPGRYVLSCFWPDADEGGLPHGFLGMFRAIRVR